MFKTSFSVKSLFRVLSWVLFLAGSAKAQRISYAELELEDSKRTNFEIIGKVGGNFMIFKNNRNLNDICVYDGEMKLIDRVRQTDMDERWINVDFIPYSDFVWMIYQFQRKNIVYCNAVKIDPKGKRISEPIELDTTRIGWAAENKIYTTVFSENKKQIMIFKINSRNPNNFMFTTMLYDQQLQLKQKHRMPLSMEERNDYFTDFLLDNEGDLVFGRFIRRQSYDFISSFSIVTKKADEPMFHLNPMETDEHMLDEVKLKIDNTNRKYIINSLYYRQRRGNMEGLFTGIWDKSTESFSSRNFLVFDETMRANAKGQDASIRTAFDDYSITDVVTRKDGGFVLLAESMYTTTRGVAYDRWGNRFYGNSPWLSPIDSYYWSPYTSPYSSLYWDRYNFGRNSQQGTRHHSENIMAFSFDGSGKMEWNNVIPKNQYDDESDALISHQLYISGGELQVLFNLYERRTLFLSNQSISADGKVTRFPTLKNLDREVEFLPRHGKQVSARSVLVPCFYRNSLTFAKVDF